MSWLDRTKFIRKFTGKIYYVSDSKGDDANSGLRPGKAKKTITGAINAASNGDNILISPEIYIENLAVTKSLHIYGEGTTVIAGTITIYAPFQWFQDFVVSPLNAPAFVCNNTFCKYDRVYNIAANPPYASTIGWDINAPYHILTDCQTLDHTVTGVDIGASYVHCYRIINHGNGNSRGFYISSSGVNPVYLENCFSQNNGISGYHIVTSAQNVTIANCTSGKNDGRWIDETHASAFEEFYYDDERFKHIDFGGLQTAYNLFEINGSVRIFDLKGAVTQAIPNTLSTIYLQLYSIGGTDEITRSVSAPNIQNAVVGATAIKNAPSTDPLDYFNPNGTPGIIENTSFVAPSNYIDLVADDKNPTYIRLILSNPLASGAMGWECKWEPNNDIGFVQNVI